MCGVAGFFGSQEQGLDFLHSSLVDLKHRGPDGSSCINLGWAGISHTRLALISPGPSGSQPVEGEELVIGFNGEIYNWKELAFELENEGIRKDLTSDSKVLLNAIEHWGMELTLPKLRGIFAFAMLEKKSNSLKLVRDAAGTKPLYYFRRSNNVYFASEIKAFKSFGLEVETDQLHEYVTFQNFLGEKTLFKDVFLVPQGAFLHFQSPEASPKCRVWDESIFTSPKEYSYSNTIERLEEFVIEAVKRNLVADFPIGLFLSGGLDSSTIAMFASQEVKNGTSYTIGFNGGSVNPGFNIKDEREIAKEIASKLGLNNVSKELSASDMEREFDALCWAVEEPRVGQSYPNYFAAKLASTYEKAVLSGAGGDELFGGYTWRYRDVLRLQDKGKNQQLESYLKIWHRLGNPTEISKLLMIPESQHLVFSKNKIERILEVNSKNSSHYELQDLLHFEFKTFLQGLLLIDDKIAMSQGIEIRVPFLDQDLTKFAMNLPNDLRIVEKLSSEEKNRFGKNGFEQTLKGKVLLRKLASKMKNPASNLPKQGFSGPDDAWFRHDSSKFVQERLFDPNSLIWSHLDYESGVRIIRSHLEGEENRKAFIWSLLSLESVFRQFSL